MTTKNMLGGALINYGDVAPAAGTAPDGALFFQTGSGLEGPGLYIYRLIADTAPGAFGNQAGAGWTRVVAFGSGLNADTLDGLDSTAFQPSSANLSGLSSLSGTGVVVRTGSGTFAGRQVTAASSRLTISNPDGVAGNISLDVVEANLNLNSIGSTLGLSKGGTNSTTTPAAGSVIFSSGTALVSTGVGTAPTGSGTSQNWQVLTSAGAGTPAWVNATSLNVAYATQAASANTATAATSATTAATATNVAWTGITGLGSGSFTGAVQQFSSTPSAPTTTYARPSYFFDHGDNLSASTVAPTALPPFSLSGFSAYSSSDMGAFQTGLSVVGSNGAYGLQIAATWDVDSLGEGAPSGLRFRVNDDTGTLNAWGAWRTIWDQGNLTNVSQLNNDVPYVTSSGLTSTLSSYVTNSSLATTLGSYATTASLSGYVAKTGDTMTGNLSAPTINAASGTFGTASLVNGTGTFSGYLEFKLPSGGNRVGYIGFANTAPAADAGTLPYIAGTHAFTGNVTVAGSISATSNITAFAPSDARLKKDVEVITGAVDTVKKLRGVSYTVKESGRREVGLIAQELKEVVPEVVRQGSDGFYGVQYGNLVGLLVEAIKEQQVQIEELKRRLDATQE